MTDEERDWMLNHMDEIARDAENWPRWKRQAAGLPDTPKSRPRPRRPKPGRPRLRLIQGGRS